MGQWVGQASGQINHGDYRKLCHKGVAFKFVYVPD